MKSFSQLKSQISEVLKASDPIEKWIDDFVHSKNPKFAGKTKAERIEMAKGAYYGAQKNEGTAVSQNTTPEVDMREAAEEHFVHVSDGSKYDEAPHDKDVEHVKKGAMIHGGKWAGHTDKGAIFKFGSHSDAEHFKRHVDKCPHRSCYADHIDESVQESVVGDDHVNKDQKLKIAGAKDMSIKDKLLSIPRGFKAMVKGKSEDDRKLKESDEAWAASQEKKKEDKLTGKDQGTLANIRALMAKEKKTVKEESEQIDEISKKTLGSYINKAHDQSVKQAVAARQSMQGLATAIGNSDERLADLHDKNAKASFKTQQKRTLGIAKAAAKLTKEEAEQITELSKKTLKSYAKKADKESEKHYDKGYNLSMKHDDSDEKMNKVIDKHFAKSDKRAAGASLARSKMDESRGHKVLATFFKNREIAQRAFSGQNKQEVPKYLEKGIETPEKDAVEKKKMMGMKEAFLSKSEEDDMKNLDAYAFYKKYGRNKAKHRQSHATSSSDVEKFTEGHDDYASIAKELVKRHGKNVTTQHIKDIEGERDSHRGLDHSEVMHHVKKLNEVDMPHDEKWTQFDAKKHSVKGAK